ncbi:NMDA-type glutamate receptor [Elysia marginata]|uniref:NMDA-type glutamate receptor n=1 Tax=Elysia marginata TaxID=1093978 RepID=A0AAV4IPM0_9GAST|nr:NMDA-type glutamate receptor [Elysia marginata]
MKRRTLRKTLQKQREEFANRANSITKQPASVALPPASSTTNAVSRIPPQSTTQTPTATGNTSNKDINNHSNSNSTSKADHVGSPKVVPPYRRLSLLEATANSDCLPPPPPSDFRQPGYVPARSGRTVTWHNPSHTRSRSREDIV